jgi:hypothetical protein
MKKNILIPILLLSSVILTCSSQAFTLASKQEILQDAIQLSPSSLRLYLQTKSDVLKTALDRQNKYFAIYKLDRALWEVRIIGHFEVLVNRLAGNRADHNTLIHFAHLVEATCNFIQFSWKDASARGFACPKRVVFDGYDRIDDPEIRIDEINGEVGSRNTYSGGNVYYDRLYVLAVNTIIDLWSTVWEISGHEITFDSGKSVVVHEETQFEPLYSRGELKRLPYRSGRKATSTEDYDDYDEDEYDDYDDYDDGYDWYHEATSSGEPHQSDHEYDFDQIQSGDHFDQIQ